MPQFLVDWHNWWLSFWIGDPVLFWLIVIIVILLLVISRQPDAWSKIRRWWAS